MGKQRNTGAGKLEVRRDKRHESAGQRGVQRWKERKEDTKIESGGGGRDENWSQTTSLAPRETHKRY